MWRRRAMRACFLVHVQHGTAAIVNGEATLPLCAWARLLLLLLLPDVALGPSPQMPCRRLQMPAPSRPAQRTSRLAISQFHSRLVPDWEGGAFPTHHMHATTVDLAPCDRRRTRNAELPSDDRPWQPGMLLPRSAAVSRICSYAHMLLCP